MKLRSVTGLAVLAGTAGALVWWRRRRRAAAQPRVQLGLADGAALSFAAAELPGDEMFTVAATLRAELEAGA